MESPVNLLNLAVCEGSAELRLAQTVKACKIISTLLPFDKKNHALVEEPELMKFLLLALPVNPRAIDMIIVSMIKKFKKLHYFLKELWYAFTMIAQLEEARTPNIQKSESAMRLYQNDVKKLLKLATLKDLDEVSYNPNSRVSEFCDMINQSKEWIKLATLEYVDQVIELYNKELKYSVAFKPDIAELLKKFIIFSPSDKVIIRVCAIIEKVSFIEKNSMLNHEIEQLVLNKQSMVIDQTMANKSFMEDTPRVRGKVKLKRALSKIKEENPTSPRRSGGTTPRSERSPSFSPMKRNQSKMLPKDDPQTTSLEDLDEAPSAPVDSVETGIEKWLSEGEVEDVPLISKSAYIYNTLKNAGNFEIILSFMFDPQAYPIGDCWKQNYPSIVQDFLDENSLVESEEGSDSKPHLKFQKLREDKFLYPFILRSYKTMLAFCDPANVKYFIQMDSSAFENYFSFLYACLNTRDDSACNFNHIAKVTSFMLIKEPEVSVNYIIYYNILYRFIQNLEFPVVEEFFLLLFNCSYSNARISNDAFKKIMKYCEIVSFFGDLTQAMLTGQKSFDMKKAEVYYKPLGVEVLVNGVMKKSDLVGMFDDNPITDRRDPNDPFLEDELSGTDLDIDSVYIVMQSAKKFDKKKVKTTNAGSYRALSQSVIEKYPSLREKYRTRNRTRTMTEGGDDGLDSDSRNNLTTPRRQGSKVSFQKQKTGFQLDERKNSNSIIIKTRVGSDFGLQTSPKTVNFQRQPTLQTPSGAVPSRPSLNNNGSESSSKVLDERKKESFLQPVTSVHDGFRSMRSVRAVTEQDEPESPQVISKNAFRSQQNWGSKLNLEHQKSIPSYLNVRNPPERMTLAQEMLNDVMTPEEAQQLNVLYPLTSANRIETEVDKEAKKLDYAVSGIKQNEHFSMQICSLFESLFRKALFAPTEDAIGELNEKLRNEDKGKKRRIGMMRKMGYLDVDYTPFWQALFRDGSTVFEQFLRNYLLKIKIHHLEEMDSGYSAGVIVNLLLSQCASHPQLIKYFNNIHTTCKEHVRFLCKVIIQSHAWPLRKDNKICLQSLEITEPLGTGRILLVETLYLILKNDEKNNNCKILSEINDTCWHTLIVWCFSKKTNNVYHRLFYSIMDLTFRHCNEKVMMNILMKLEMLSSMYKAYGEVYLNNVIIKENCNESIICYLKKLTLLIDAVSNSNERYTTLRTQLGANMSWNHLKDKFVPKPPPEKKKVSQIPGRRGSQFKGRDSFLSNRNTPRGESRNSVFRGLNMSGKRDSVMKVPPIATSSFK